MRFLIADTGGVWEMTHSGGVRTLEMDLPSPCMPCACQSLLAVCCQRTRECLCMDRQSRAVISRMPSVPGVSGMIFSPCGRWLYQLSSEADCIHTRLTATGELCYAASCGVFPRCMKRDAKGDVLLAAGGAAAEACLFSAPELHLQRTVYTRHPCFAADFWQGGLVLVCAAEGEDIHTVVYTLAHGKIRPRKLAELPGMPGDVCVCPDGAHALISTRSGLMKLALRDGSIVWNRLEWPLCMRIGCREEWILLSDTLDGNVGLIHQHRPWEKKILFSGTAAQACFA